MLGAVGAADGFGFGDGFGEVGGVEGLAKLRGAGEGCPAQPPRLFSGMLIEAWVCGSARQGLLISGEIAEIAS